MGVGRETIAAACRMLTDCVREAVARGRGRSAAMQW